MPIIPVSAPDRREYALNQLKQFGEDTTAIVFVERRKDAKHIHEQHKKDAPRARHYLVRGNKCDPALSKKVWDDFRAGRPYRIVATIDSGARGLDFPPASAILLLNNVRNLLNVIQLASRGRWYGKSAGVLFWFVGDEKKALGVVSDWKATEAHEMEMAKHARSAGPIQLAMRGG
jgi:superfamily II DNA/RNA helicase